VVVAIGAIPTGFALTLPPAQLLAQTKATQIARLTTSYNAAIQLSVSYMATSFQADSASQDVLTKSRLAGCEQRCCADDLRPTARVGRCDAGARMGSVSKFANTQNCS
jgi:hypothetical protein